MQGFHALPAHAEQQKEKQTPGALSPDEWRSFKVKEVRDINHNTKLWRQVSLQASAACAVCRLLLAARVTVQQPTRAVVCHTTARASDLSCGCRCRFALPDANQEVGLPVASCLVTRYASTSSSLQAGCHEDLLLLLWLHGKEKNSSMCAPQAGVAAVVPAAP